MNNKPENKTENDIKDESVDKKTTETETEKAKTAVEINTSFSDYFTEIKDYASKNPGYTALHTAAWAVFGVSAALLVTAAVSPALIPFAFAQAGFWIKAATLGTAAVGAAVSAYTTVLPQVAAPLQILHARNLKGDASLPERIGYGAISAVSVAFVAALFLAPAYLPFGLAAVAAYNVYLQAAIAVALTVTTVYATGAAFSMWKQAPKGDKKPEAKLDSTVTVDVKAEAANDTKVAEEKTSSSSFKCF